MISTQRCCKDNPPGYSPFQREIGHADGFVKCGVLRVGEHGKSEQIGTMMHSRNPRLFPIEHRTREIVGECLRLTDPAPQHVGPD